MSLSRFPLAALAALLVLVGCDSGGPDDATVGAVYVLNQGQFGNNDSGSITTYDPTTGQVSRLDNPRALVQAGLVSGDQFFVLLNYSDSFETGRGLVNVVSPSTGNVVRQFDVGTPRGLAVLGGVAYVSDLYGGGVTPVTLSSGEVGEVIPTGDNPEGVAVAGGRVFVANSGFGFGSTLSVLAGGAVTNIIDLGCAGPNDVVAVDDAEVWVVCTGTSDFTSGEVTSPGQVVVVDVASLSIVARFGFEDQLLGGAALGQDIAYDATENVVYVLQTVFGANEADTVYRFDVAGRRLDAGLEITGADASGIGFGGGQLYVGRLNALNPFSDDGTVTVHDRSGDEIARFTAGVVPAAFAFASRDLTTQE